MTQLGPKVRCAVRVGDRFRNASDDGLTFTVYALGFGADRMVRIDGRPKGVALATYKVSELREKVRLPREESRV